MKTCPQCGTGYEQDYVFCLNDGKPLYDGDGETDTVYSKTIPIKIPVYSSDSAIYCAACGAENGDGSNFCKKCGRSLNEKAPTIAGSTYGQPRVEAQNLPPVVVIEQPKGKNYSWLFAAIALAAIFVCLLTVVGSFIYINQLSPEKAVVTPTPVNKPLNSIVPTNRDTNKAFNSNTSTIPVVIGRKGHLTTNQRIRAASNKNAEITGVHYMNAKVQVLDVESYPTPDGDSTWYRVRVLENGCDAEGILGCGNDLNGVSGNAETEGWMNARYIDLD